MSGPYDAGKRLRLERTFTRATGETTSVNPSTVTVKVCGPTGAVIALASPTVTYAGDGSSLTAITYWDTGDTAAGGEHTVEWDVSGGLIDAYSEKVTISARRTV